jgi:hypothetical protein
LIFSMLPEKENLKLVIDRTNWQFGKQNINIFMLLCLVLYSRDLHRPKRN